MKTVQRIFLYVASIIHIPWTIIRVVVSITLLVDLWCDKIINNWLKELNKEIREEKEAEILKETKQFAKNNNIIYSKDIEDMIKNAIRSVS